MGDITTRNKDQKLLICIYTNNDRNEFAIGLKEDENFRAMTKLGEFYTRFVDAFEEMVVVDEKEIDWKQKLKKWIASAKENEAIFTEVDLSGWNEHIQYFSKNFICCYLSRLFLFLFLF